MKRVILFLFASVMLFTGFAQSPVTLTTTGHSNALDTVTNTAAVSTNPLRASTFRTGFVAQIVVTKISGTVAGTLGIYGSLDATAPTHWNLIGSATTPTDATNNYRLATTEKWFYYKIMWTGAGTMSASYSGKYWTY